MTKNQGILNDKKRLTVEHKIAVSNALTTVETKLEKSGISILKKEYPSLWSRDTKKWYRITLKQKL